MTDNPYLARRASRPIGAAGRRSEQKTARRLGLAVTPASGAAITKGDLRDEDWLVEAKSTTGESLGIKLSWLLKIAGEAALVGKAPALSIAFVDQRGEPHRGGAWIAIPEAHFRQLQSTATTEG